MSPRRLCGAIPPTPCEGVMPKLHGHLISVRKNPIEPAHRTFRVKLLSREIALAHFDFESRREPSNSMTKDLDRFIKTRMSAGSRRYLLLLSLIGEF